MQDEKAKKFVELANKRVNKALKELQLVGNLSNKSNYLYSDAQAQKIIVALQTELDSVRKKFKDACDNRTAHFHLELEE